MIIRAYNLAFAFGVTALTIIGLLRGPEHRTALATAFAIVAACWSASAVGLFLKNRIAWIGSIVGTGMVLACSLAMFIEGVKSTPLANDPTDGTGYRIIFGALGPLLRLQLRMGFSA